MNDEEILKRMSNTNDYIFTETYRRFLSLVMESTKRNPHKNQEKMDDIIKDINTVLSGRGVKECILGLSFLISNVFVMDDAFFKALEETNKMTNQIQDNKENPSYV